MEVRQRAGHWRKAAANAHAGRTKSAPPRPGVRAVPPIDFHNRGEPGESPSLLVPRFRADSSFRSCSLCRCIRGKLNSSQTFYLAGMTACLPPNLLALFEARPPIPYLPPPTDLLIDKKEKGKCPQITGIAEYVTLFEVSSFVFRYLYLLQLTNF